MLEILMRDLDTNQNLQKCRLSSTLWNQAVDGLRKIKSDVESEIEALNARQAGRCVLCNQNVGDERSSLLYKFSSPHFPINKDIPSHERQERGLTNDYVFFTIDVRIPICSDCVRRANEEQKNHVKRVNRKKHWNEVLRKIRTYTMIAFAVSAGAVSFAYTNWFLALVAMIVTWSLCEKIIPEPGSRFKQGEPPLEAHQKAIENNPYTLLLKGKKFTLGNIGGVGGGLLCTNFGCIDTRYVNHRIEV